MYSPPKKKGPRRNAPKFTGKIRLHVGDTVRVISGKDKGKEGKITRVLPTLGQVVVDGVNIVIKHQKARPQMNAAMGGGQQAGRIENAAPLHISKVQLVNGGATSRIGVKQNANGERVRFAKKSGEVIDNG